MVNLARLSYTTPSQTVVEFRMLVEMEKLPTVGETPNNYKVLCQCCFSILLSEFNNQSFSGNNLTSKRLIFTKNLTDHLNVGSYFYFR